MSCSSKDHSSSKDHREHSNSHFQYWSLTAIKCTVNGLWRRAAYVNLTRDVTHKNSNSSDGGRRHLTFLTTVFNKSENFASFRSKFSQRKGLRGRARTLFMSFSSFGLDRSAPQTERETFSCFSTLLSFLLFCSLSFFILEAD